MAPCRRPRSPSKHRAPGSTTLPTARLSRQHHAPGGTRLPATHLPCAHHSAGGWGCAHEVEGAVRRDERDGAVVLKARQAHALVELHVLQVDRLVLPAAPLRIKQHLRMRRACCHAPAACVAHIVPRERTVEAARRTCRSLQHWHGVQGTVLLRTFGQTASPLLKQECMYEPCTSRDRNASLTGPVMRGGHLAKPVTRAGRGVSAEVAPCR